MCVTSWCKHSSIGVESSYHDLYYVCYSNQYQIQTKINCKKIYLIFNEKWTTEVSWDGQDVASWDNHSLCVFLDYT